ncbi:hypothetical protein HOY82DRAFT_580144 [Tuber indicum]|nr:hypothetical protein HOY82DRAFT_580144 [Tuber indicum]
MSQKASVAPLVWIDCELCYYITNHELNVPDEEGHGAVVHYEKEAVAFLAGNSVHFDRAFLARHYPSVVEHLHHRIIDILTVKEAEVYGEVPGKKFSHEAGMDILGGKGELSYYKSVAFHGKKRSWGGHMLGAF